jgi:hypothetical protein
MAEKTDPPLMRSKDLRATLDDITDLLMTMRREQMQLEAYGQVTRLALGALLRAVPAEARAAVAARLSAAPESLLGPDLPASSPLGQAVLEEAARMAAALRA